MKSRSLGGGAEDARGERILRAAVRSQSSLLSVVRLLSDHCRSLFGFCASNQR